MLRIGININPGDVVVPNGDSDVLDGALVRYTGNARSVWSQATGMYVLQIQVREIKTGKEHWLSDFQIDHEPPMEGTVRSVPL